MEAAEARARMLVEQLARRGIRDARVLEAMARVPRERFVPPELAARAYDDAPLPIGEGQTISQPYIVARMTEALALDGGGRVLEIGTGSGYQAAVLSLLAREVVTVERHEALARDAAARLSTLGCGNVRVLVGDGSEGLPEEPPFDAILVAAGAPAVPGALLARLAPGGRMVVPVGPRDEQTLEILRRLPDGRVEAVHDIPCRFVPLVGTGGWRT